MTRENTPITPSDDGAMQDTAFEAASRFGEAIDPIHLVGQDDPNPVTRAAVAGEIDPLGLHVKEAIATINQLEGLGLQRLKIPLPKCIVLGEQSTGKSSVIEAISGIKTPRSTDTCTRCPLFIKLEPSENLRAGWSATVSLRREYSFDVNMSRNYECRFPGWVQMDQPNIVHFAETDDPNELERIIARAQLSVISPLTDYREFLRPTIAGLGDQYRCEFSPNIICISITHPDLPALSFYDLPGIIGQAESAESQFLVKFVRDLVTDYIKDPEALILVTCSLENDIANSTAGGIARSLNATDRCIGVLTKPDRLPPGSRHDKLKAIFEQKRFALGHGYSVVKNLGQDQIDQGLTHQQARHQEQQFFNQEEPWATEFKKYEHRFGTLNLQGFLSGKLAEQITKKLPIIDQEITIRLHEVETALLQFPESPTHNASRIISDVILDFSQEVRKELAAEFPCKIWRNHWKALQQAFFDALLEGTPGPSPIKTPTRRGVANTSETRAASPDFSNLRKKFFLDEVKQHLAENSQSRIRGQIEPRVVDAMMLDTLKDWGKPLGLFFNTLEGQIHDQIKSLFDKHFSKWAKSTFQVRAWEIVEQMLNMNFHQQRTTMADENLNDEREGPYIFHQDIFDAEKANTLDNYNQARLRARLNIYKKTRERRTGKVMTTTDEDRLRKDEKAMTVLNREPYLVEIGVVAQVTTYYMLAVRRFHDAVCMRIESKFYKQLRTQLRDEMENGLGLNDGDEGHRNAVRLLAEEPARYNQRKELVGQQQSLLKGKKILRELQHKHYDSNPSSAASTGSRASYASGAAFAGMPTPLHEGMDGVRESSLPHR
ncbi:interferon-induced GTP-binding protein Mx [Pyrenophora tritici-repentis]|nr:interferon-induced GTP-binding protein Mx [Pyrenophora tritici-repentis]KAI0579851.1 interferon-induced GTP-binding protein Mx [Pyrenophora tritici-repentis]KAI0619640.1 interferon-induced GTP-binding protein Mx [Pyrenophora tritici-repentis]KAI1530419.1 interferon-induced GTP-binding protein Mx [Pyrenophora tritici-repentis]KAI1548884.1 interferon-induced GTP-binding protein Mx [Pyrenophora tritici-repentis]